MLRSSVLALGTSLLLVAQEPADFDALAREYEQVLDAWIAARSRTGGDAQPEAGMLSSLAAFRPRFEAFAAQGEGRATLWLIGNPAPGSGPTLLAQVKRGGDAEWVGSALYQLGEQAQGFPHEELVAFLEERSEKAGSPLLRAYAALALAEVVASEDAAHAAHLRLSAVVLAEMGLVLAPGEQLGRDDAVELGELLVERVEKEARGHFARAYRQSSDGSYFPAVGAPADPEARWRPALEELALLGSTRALLWAIDHAPWQLDAAGKERLRGFLETVASAPLPEEDLRGFGYQIGGLVYRLGLAAVEPSVRRLIEGSSEAARPGLLFGLGAAVCEAAREDETMRARGLGILREVRERWPASEEARRAEGRIFRFTNLVVGKVAPEFESVDSEGSAFKLSDYRGKVTVVDFWGFW